MRPILPIVLAFLAACGGSRTEEGTQAAIQGLDTIVVTAGDATAGRAWDGVVEAVNQATLSAQTGGRVAAVLHDVNDAVDAGEVLVRLTAVEQQAGADAARAQLRAAQAAAAEAESTYQRYLSLSKGQFVSKAQLDQVRATRDTAIAARDAARAQVADAGQQAAYTTVRAPYAGIVSTRDVEPGESVGVGQVLMTVFDPDTLRIEVNLPQSEAARVRAAPAARVTFDDGRNVDAAGVTVFPSADPSSHAVRARVALPAMDPAPRPGSTAKVAFPAVAGDAFPRVPASALVRRGEVTGVYVLADGHLSLRQLRLGGQVGDAFEVIAGLAPGEAIAADPVAAVQALVAAREDAR